MAGATMSYISSPDAHTGSDSASTFESISVKPWLMLKLRTPAVAHPASMQSGHPRGRLPKGPSVSKRDADRAETPAKLPLPSPPRSRERFYASEDLSQLEQEP